MTFAGKWTVTKLFMKMITKKFRGLCKNFPNNMDLIAMPVIEFWGGPEKVRADIFPMEVES